MEVAKSWSAKKTWKLIFASSKLNNGEKCNYGFGWRIEEELVAHSGGWVGFSTYFVNYLKPEPTVIVLSDNNSFEAGELAEMIGKIYPR